MQKHTKIYFKAFGYDKTDFVCSEISGKKATDIHHIECKGMGGNPNGDKNCIENLQALTREEHIKYGDKERYKKFLYKKHYDFLKLHNVSFNEDYFKNKI